MQLVIAEKPSVAKEIARVLGAGKYTREWYEGNGYTVTWLLGHLLELDTPLAGNAWNRDELPILPEKFTLKPIHLDLHSGQRDRLDVLKELEARCEGIVVATDAGREGELIFRNIYAYLRSRKPFRRLWISSLTEESIRDGFNHLRDGHEFDTLALAAMERTKADWLVGVNATRALTLACGGISRRKSSVLSLGRVQTPTLAMICRRYLEHKNFVPEPYWYLQGEVEKDGVRFKVRSVDRYNERRTGQELHAAIQEERQLTVESVEARRTSEQPPLLFDIGALQKEANARYGYTLAETLGAAQSLYEKKLITYPRTSSRYIPDDVFNTIGKVLGNHIHDERYGGFCGAVLEGQLCRRSVNAQKVSDHHGLLVTGVTPHRDKLSVEEERIYDLILERSIEAFSPACIADKKTIGLSACGVVFSVTSRKVVSPGWRSVGGNAYVDEKEGSDDAESMEMSDGELPDLEEGDVLDLQSLLLIEDKTRPKPLLTDATLVTAMENAGKNSDDKEVYETLRETGIGTAATRAEVLSTLERRGFVERKKKALMPTDLGLQVWVALKDSAIANIEMTARWERALEEIREGRRSPQRFSESIRRYTAALTDEILNRTSLERLQKTLKEKEAEESIICPRCGREMRLGSKSAWCVPGRGGCGYTVYREIAGKTLSDATMKSLINTGSTRTIDGFISREKKLFSARLSLTEDGKVVFVRGNENKKSS